MQEKWRLDNAFFQASQSTTVCFFMSDKCFFPFSLFSISPYRLEYNIIILQVVWKILIIFFFIFYNYYFLIFILNVWWDLIVEYILIWE